MRIVIEYDLNKGDIIVRNGVEYEILDVAQDAGVQVIHICRGTDSKTFWVEAQKFLQLYKK